MITERCYPYFFTFIICLFLYYNQEKYIIKEMFQSICNDTFLTTIIAALSIAWGFLLSTFTILIQSNTKAIAEIRRVKRFSELVNYNKTAVYCVFITTILTSILLLIIKIKNITYLYVLKSIWVILIILSIFLCYRFLRLFYILTKEN